MKIAEYQQMMDYLTGPRESFRKGGSVTTPKRGLVDEPGSYSGEFDQKYLYRKRNGYIVRATKGDVKIEKPFKDLDEARAYAKEVEEKFNEIKAKKPRDVTGKKLTIYNKFSQNIHGKNYNDLTKAEKNIVQTRYRQSGGKFRKTFQTSALTDLNQERIKKAFPDIEFEFKKGQKLGVPLSVKGKRNPVFTAVSNFINNDYKLSVKKSLPVSTQRDIVANFELPKGVKEWNFDVNKGGYLYGVPDTSGANMNLGARIKNFVNEPKPYKIAADFGNPEGWLLTQMNRAFESKQNTNFIPKYDLVNGKKKIVGFTDNQYGGGKTYYALKKYANKFNGTMMTEHPDFKNTKKYIDIANKVKLAPNKVIKDLLIKGGVTDDRITLNNLLQYMVNEKGVEPTKRGLVLHHKGGVFANPTRDFQILNTAINLNIKGVESAMRSNPANITPKNIKFLKDAGASITINGTTYGGGPKTAIGGFRQTEQFVQEKLKGFGDKDFQNLNKYLAALGCGEKRFAGQTGGNPTRQCILAGANKINNPKLIKPGAEARNAAQFLNRAAKIGRTVMKFGVIPEAIFVAGESLIRMGMGDTLSESLLRASDYLLPGNQTKMADKSKFERTVGPENALTIMRARDYKNAIQELADVEVNADIDIQQNMEDFTGISDQELTKIKEDRIKQATQNVKNKFVSEAVTDKAAALESDAIDIAGTNNIFKKIGVAARNAKVDDIETLAAPEQQQKGTAPPMLTNKDLADVFITDDFLQREKDERFDGIAPELTKENVLNFYRGMKPEELQGQDNILNQQYFRTVFDDARRSDANRERLFGTQRDFFGGTVEGRETPTNRFADFKLGMYAGGGIAKLAGKSSGPAPEKGPTSQGLAFFKNNGRKL
jgi:hypothetical protein